MMGNILKVEQNDVRWVWIRAFEFGGIQFECLAKFGASMCELTHTPTMYRAGAKKKKNNRSNESR